MNYELFQKAAAINAELEVIPSKIKILSSGATIDDKGCLCYDGKTYLPNMIKLKDLPKKMQSLFLEESTQLQEHSSHSIQSSKPANNKQSQLDKLNKILFEQLENIVDPEDNTDMDKELKKAATVCNISDKIIGIADLALKAEKLYSERSLPGRNLYE